MIFQSKKEEPVEQVAPVAPAIGDENLQDEQELAKVLADIDAQVGVNSEELAAATADETAANATEAELPKSDEIAEKNESETVLEGETADQSSENETPADKTMDFEKIEEEINDSQEQVEFQTSESEPTLVADETSNDTDTLNDLNNQIAAGMANLADGAEQSAFETPVASFDSTPESVVPSTESVKPDYDSLKKRALGDLRPIIDKIKLNDEESFDVLLLMIRETDDESLLDKAYEAARQITDETRRAQALLDVIKEAEYFKHKN